MRLKINTISTFFILVFVSFVTNAQQGEVTIDQDEDIKKLLEYKKDIKTNMTYKIQVFQSVDPDRAQKEKSNFLNSYGDWPVDIHWNTPNYKVWVGNFSTRLEADRALVKIKKKYMNAIIFQPKSEK
ncbi:SPOR domain-containing protein [Winogradskyella sp. A2]|uniref:SPOR domain-containing protein n=1 Tax=Winogradskyella sp. A2 TaxID=3366944 RepID=UPI00398C4F3F